MYSDVKAVYVDTGLEFPEIKDHVKSFTNVTIIRPKMSFRQVLEKYGWVFPSKEIACDIYYARKGSTWAKNKFEGLDKDGNYSKYKQNSKKWKFMLNAPVKISEKCCYVMKKEPVKRFEKESKLYCVMATMAQESRLRENAWIQKGCNIFDGVRKVSKPMSFWTEQDVLQYIKDNNIKIPSVYGDIIEEDGKLRCTGNQRTGCMFCPVGLHLEKRPNRIERMKTTHPKIYEYCMNGLGLKGLLDFAGEHLGKELY